MKQAKILRWHCRDRSVELGERTLVMGILNVTPDSFSDGGRFFDGRQAVEHGLRMAQDGADLIDVGGESTRPGSESVSPEEELRRIGPVIEALARETKCLVSVDTRKAGVAEKALALGAHIINDVSALTSDPAMPAVAARHGAGLVLMHMRGEPKTMQADPRYGDVVSEVAAYLGARLADLGRQGLRPEAMAVDPGIGFGKTAEHNVSLLAHLDALAALGRPVVVGVSRKSFLGKITGREVGDRLAGSLGAAAYAVLRGAHVIRVHDVKESCDVARLVDIFKREEPRDVRV
ncbi:MAG: dihydropteroate synthase [Verrucomicrobiota bacterium]